MSFLSLSQIITNLVRFVFSKNFDRVSISCTQFFSLMSFLLIYILQGISLFNFQGPFGTLRVPYSKHWSALPTYSFALSSDSIIISQFSSFVKSLFCELSVNRFSVSLENFRRPYIARIGSFVSLVERS